MNKVLIATSCRSENARYIDFYRTRDDLIVPEGSKLKLYPGFFPDYNINDAVSEVLTEDYSHLFIVDDDQMLPPDTLMRLLNRDLDIVSVNLLLRTPPFGPYMFRNAQENGVAFQIELPDKEGPVVEVDACGTGGMLIKTEVFRNLESPWFCHDDILKTYDMYFCRNARRAGYKIHVDLSCPSGHIAICSVWPDRSSGEWKTTVIIANSVRITVPKAKEIGPNKLQILESHISGETLHG